MARRWGADHDKYLDDQELPPRPKIERQRAHRRTDRVRNRLPVYALVDDFLQKDGDVKVVRDRISRLTVEYVSLTLTGEDPSSASSGGEGICP